LRRRRYFSKRYVMRKVKAPRRRSRGELRVLEISKGCIIFDTLGDD
jgi:hypothetical protein